MYMYMCILHLLDVDLWCVSLTTFRWDAPSQIPGGLGMIPGGVQQPPAQKSESEERTWELFSNPFLESWWWFCCLCFLLFVFLRIGSAKSVMFGPFLMVHARTRRRRASPVVEDPVNLPIAPVSSLQWMVRDIPRVCSFICTLES